MADWAGAAGAGAASDALRQILTDRLLAQKVAEDNRRAQVEEQQRAQELAQRAEAQRAAQALQMTALGDARDAGYQNRLLNTQRLDADTQQHSMDQQIHARTRTEDLAAQAAARAADEAFRTKEREGRQSFEMLMARRAGSGQAASEPLVAIKDPTTGQPVLVPRSQASGKSPASTREQAMTEGQSNAAGFADQMKFNEDVIKAHETEATSRTTQAQGWLPGEMQSDAYQQYTAAKGNWIAAKLRKESGAAISESEYANADRQYFPQPGEGAKTVEQKRKLRAVAEASMRRASGPAAMTETHAPPLGNDLGKEW